MYHDAESEPAQALAGGILRARELSGTVDPETPEGRGIIEFFLERARGMQAAARFLWPVPDKGLRKRLHRVRQPVLLLWGEHDGIVPPAYAEEFASILPDARIELVPDASHMVTAEQPARVGEAVEAFLRD
jgi:pimeloyl-ACP methyl ester carboxylesterase